MSHALSTDHQVLAGGGAMGDLMRSIDWSKTPLGPVSGWSQALRTTIGLVLRNKFPILVWWGPRFVQFYNDTYRPILADKHPPAMGQPGPECWAEIWDIIGPMAEAPLLGGEATSSDDLIVLMNRRGFPEETHFKVAYSPVPDETVHGTGIGGVIATVAETTEQIYGDRQLRTLRELGARAADAKTSEVACKAAALTLQENAWDIPFALIYLIDDAGSEAALAGYAGFDEGDTRSPQSIDLGAPDADTWEVARVVITRQTRVISDLGHRFAAMPAGRWSTPPHTAIVLPLGAPDQPRLYGVLVVGLNPHRALDDGYRYFLDLAASQIVAALRNAFAYQEERQRAEALARLDQAKTAFFSNVSHEFRTPITLMLGPLEDLIGRQDLTEQVRQPVALAHRNAVRLLKLVNSLLDFARMEAGRIEARFRPVDLAASVAGIASQFGVAMEKARLEFIVTCPTLSQAAYLDTDLFEKVILNLLSNALKFTLQGSIEVAVTEVDDRAVVTVRDTGVGIPRHELPRIFERFHRVEGSRGRSFEGTGIGLALVRELVERHGGNVSVESEEGRGSIFTVVLPLGRAHLPPERVVDQAAPLEAQRHVVQAHLLEAFGWLPSDGATAPALPAEGDTDPARADPALAAGPRHRIVLADDNADMRGYVLGLLASRYDVVPTANGVEALAAIRRDPPDLVLTDVMMPEMDGFALLRELRADERTRALPVILLSARAGEEASVTGLDAGADDYLIKPFSAIELVARIESNLRLSRIRGDLARAEAARLASLRHGEELASINAELQRANNDLERFSYGSAHDLQEPLRMIINYLDLVHRHEGAALSTRGKQHIQKATNGAIRMRALINDLLAFSRIGRVDTAGKRFAATDALQEAIANLQLAIDDSKARVTIGDLYEVMGSQAQLTLVFQNLIGNALTYRRQDVQPEIAITAAPSAGSCQFTVSDNGIGIDQANFERIFDMFQRLHSRTEFAGSGIGLATCKRIVEGHRGRIWVTSAAGQGSAFHFTWPTVPQDGSP